MDKKITAPTPKPSKTHEKRLRELMNFMVEQTEKRFRNNVLLALNKKTIKKFTVHDSQDGNFAVIVQKLAKNVSNKILSQFSDARIKDFVKTLAKSADAVHRSKTLDILSDTIGIDMSDVAGGMSQTINSEIEIITAWVKQQRNDTLTKFTNNTLQMMSGGASFDDILKNLTSQKKISIRKNKQIARAQMANFNSTLTRTRYGRLGIDEAVWVGADDERERPSHKERNGKMFDLNKGLYSKVDGLTLFPGQDYGCRCVYKAVIPPDLLKGVK